MLVFLVRLFVLFFSLLPLSVALAFGRGLGWIYGHVIRYHRKEALENLARCFPEKTFAEHRALLNEVYLHTGMNLAEFARTLSGRRQNEVRELVDIQGLEILKNELSRGRGVIALTSHLGNWEYLALRVAMEVQPAGLVIKELKDGALNRFLIEARKRQGLEVFERRGAFREILRQLKKRNLTLGFVLDQNMMWKEGVFVNFFGRPACTTPGLAQLAAMAQCMVIPVKIERLAGGRHRITVEPAMAPPPDTSDEAVLMATAAYTACLERQIRDNPGQWIWMHRRWRTTMDKVGTP